MHLKKKNPVLGTGATRFGEVGQEICDRISPAQSVLELQQQ
ncbi:hypothetical protein [Nostoc sp.]